MTLRIFGLLIFLSHFTAAQNRTKGVSQRVECVADSSQQYALYLPSCYSSERKFPVIIFLDPAARGAFPVEKYHLVSEEYGVVMAGSYNSKNFDAASSFESFTAIYNDLKQHYSIDSAMIWVAGFSGGSRAASAIALTYPQVSGVIACGAGFAGMQDISPKNLKAYAAIVGDRDMNFGELLEDQDYMDELNINNILFTFEGGHDWPPLTPMRLALLWITDKPDKINTVSEEFDSLIWKQVNQKVEAGFFYAAWLEVKQLEKIPLLKSRAGLISNKIDQHKNFAADKKHFEEVMEEERKYMNEFSLVFNQLLLQSGTGSIEKEVWLQKARRIEQMCKDRNNYRQLSGKRCADHSTRSCLEYYFQLMNSREYSKAATIAEVMLYFDPKSSNTSFLVARAEAGSGNKKGCEKNLKNAIKNGLILNKRIEDDPLLLRVLSQEEIKKIFAGK
ncbi:MAG: hypothetical protein V9F01_05220 [Chitinophagaceae bacterium]